MKTQVVTKLKNSNCDTTQKSQIVTVVIVTVVTVKVIVTYFSKKQLDTSTTNKMFSGQLFAILVMLYIAIGFFLSSGAFFIDKDPIRNPNSVVEYGTKEIL